MIDPTVRLAQPGDAAPLAELEHEARAALVDARGGARWLEEHPAIGLGWHGVVGERVVFIAELEPPDASCQLPVGYLVLDVTGAVARIDQVFVTPEARELGFGDALLDAAIESARAAGARVLEGEALPGDRQTKNLYERAGITARLITVSTPLTQSPTHDP